jgi:hypothetical protein
LKEDVIKCIRELIEERDNLNSDFKKLIEENEYLFKNEKKIKIKSFTIKNQNNDVIL